MQTQNIVKIMKKVIQSLKVKVNVLVVSCESLKKLWVVDVDVDEA